VSLPYGETLSAASWSRLRSLATSRSTALELGAIAISAVIFLASVLPNLANHPTLTDDEAWVMSASYKLAEEGVFGSDMFRGFFNADGNYFFNMPAHHFAVAASFKLLGAGVVQARVVGVAYGLAVILLTYLLARRLYGVAAAVLALGLLLFLRLNMGFDTGLPLQELAANVRYDLAPVPFVLGAFLLLLGGPSLARAAAAGALLGLSTLFQFYGAFAVPVAIAFISLEALPRTAKLKLAGVLAAAAALVCLPYALYALANLDDLRGQAGTVDQRDDFLSPSFYVDSLLHEPDRFLRPLAFKEVPRGEDPRTTEPRFLDPAEMAVRRPSAKLGVLVGLPLALAYSGWRAFKEGRRGDRLLFLALAGLTVEYALFESAKLYIYWIAVVPLLCTGIAGAATWLLRPPRGDRLRLAAAAFTALCLLGIFAEGAAARISGFRAADNETEYARLAALIHDTVPERSRVVGSTSLWWGLRDTDYRSYFMFFYVTSPNAGPYRTTISDFLTATEAEYLVLTRLGVEELEDHLAPGDRADFEASKAARGTLVRRIDGEEARSYGYVEIWRLR
jgi:4-amino-4-deoxy-L-arabinose transferase-like glycosyltransferase